MRTPLQVFSLWGQAFEIAVKRGVLVQLQAAGLVASNHPSLVEWQKLATADVYTAIARELAETDQNQKIATRETARHLFELGMGLGQTAMREYLKKLKGDPEDYSVRALWCPFQMPRVQGDFDAETEALLTAVQAAFGFAGPIDPRLSDKGFPARADFLLWLAPQYPKLEHEFLCLEFSLNGLPDTADYRRPAAHLDELRRYAWYLDTRSVFSRVCAEVSGEGFVLSPRIKEHLPAFTGRDKPFYKLCQAASYVQTCMKWLQSKEVVDRPFNTRALAITQNGFESLAASFFKSGTTDPRMDLLNSLGRAYRETEKIPDDDEQGLDDHIRYALDQLRKALPTPLRRALSKLHELPAPGESFLFNFEESVETFHNPMGQLSWMQAQAEIDSTPSLSEFLGQEARQAVVDALKERVREGEGVPLRDLHAAAVVTGMRAARPGQMTVLGLEGNPGIGKTTAVVSALKQAGEGFLFLYVSPRVIINDDVTAKLAQDEQTKQPSGILTVTTNSRLIASARQWYETQATEAERPKRRIDSAVIADGVAHLKAPDSSTLILSPDQKEELEALHLGSKSRKRAETERQDRIEDQHTQGVLSVLAETTRALLKSNSLVDRVVLTAAIQGYRETGAGRSTLHALSKLFRNPTTLPAGIRERQELAQRIPTIVVMVDELTGDGAGALFVHAVARWLDEQFIKPFKEAPAFKVILVIADASLANEIVLDRYLNSGQRTPDKVLVSPSAGQRPFRLAVTPIRIGGIPRSVLHIMTNSYPASQLSIEYRVRLDVVTPNILADGRLQTVRQAIAEQQGQVLIDHAVLEIERAVAAGADQVIFFAQDKRFLREVEALLTSGTNRPALLNLQQVATLDSSVTAARRKALISEDRRDQIKVFLMTSSGARGVSFPKADWIIALVPRFDIEAALMEIAQLIYRGRGGRYTADDGEICTDGDWKRRHLVMMLQDFLPEGTEPEPRQWLRQVSDLLTFLVMLRAAIYTRITGDAGLGPSKLALVPVGGIGSEEMLSLMSTQVSTFLHECDVGLRDAALPNELRGLITNAQKYATHLFSKFALDASARSSQLKSVARIEDMEAFSSGASADNASLWPDLREAPDLVLPEHLYCVGPFWLEHWEHLNKQERFSIEGWLTDVDDQVKTLFGQLRHIKAETQLSSPLRTSAEELYRILAREKEEATREFSTIKALKSSSTWLAVPIDYARFWHPAMDGQSPNLEGEDEAWRQALGRCLGARNNIVPVIARYAGIPYAAVAGATDPAELELLFDDRYLATSNELNLLNTLLLAKPHRQP